MPVTFSEGSTATFPQPAAGGRMTFIDADGDGDMDILYQTGANGTAFQYAISNGDGAYTIVALASSPFAGLTIPDHNGANFHVGDIDGDGDMDLWAGQTTGAGTGSYFRNDGGSFSSQSSATFPAPGASSRVVMGDFDNDGDADMLYQTVGNGTAFQYAESNGDGTYTLLAQASSPFAGLTLIDNGGGTYYAGDFDGDGDTDVWAASASTTGSYYRNDGGGSFSAQSSATLPAPAAATRVAVGDFDSDGDDDILYQTAGDGSVWQYARSNGDGTFTILSQAASPFAGVTLLNHNGSNSLVGDIDGDGDDDLIITTNGTQGEVYYAAGSPPSIASTTPADNGTGVGTGADITLTFDESVTKGSGNIYLYRGDGVLIETISVGSAQVTGSGTTWTINPSVTLAGVTNYYVMIDDGTWVDADGSIFAGIDDAITLNFTTAASNTAPTFTNLNGDTPSFTEGAAVRLDVLGNATVADSEQSNFNGGTLTVSITANEVAAQDVLSVANIGNGAGQISVSGANISYAGVQIATFTGGAAGADLVITLDGDATPAATQALVRALQYINTSNAPNASSRTITVVLTDGAGGTSATQTTTVSITAVNDAPVNVVPGAAIDAVEDGSVAITGLSVSDVDANPATDTVTVTLSVTDGTLTISTAVVNGVGAGGVAGNGTDTIVLTGTLNQINATLANATALQFQGAADFNGAVTLTMTSNDGGASGNDPGQTGSGTTEADSDTRTINVASVNDEPAGQDGDATILEDGVHTFAASDFGFNDAADGDGLAAVVFTTLPTNGVLVVVDGDGDVVQTLTAGGSVTVAQLNGGLVQYRPDANESGAPHDTFTFQVQDDGGTANGGVNLDQTPNTFTFDVTAVNDAPTLAITPADGDYTEGDAGFTLFSGSTVTNPEAGEELSLTFQVSGVADGGDEQLVLSGVPIEMIAGSPFIQPAPGGAVMVQVTASATPGVFNVVMVGISSNSHAQQILDAIVYRNESEAPTEGDRLITLVSISDNGGGANSTTVNQTATVTVVAVDSVPVAVDDGNVTGESAPVSGSVFSNDSDPDGPALSVAEVNGSAADVGVQITLASGALLTVNADGTYTYDPNGVFDALADSSSGSLLTFATDSFTYTLAGGGTATVTIVIGGEDSDDLILGDGADNVLDGGAGDDLVIGGAGNDTMDGGSGQDTADYMASNAGVSVFLNGNVTRNDGEGGSDTAVGFENVNGSAFNDVIVGNSGANELSGGDGVDVLVGLDGDDVLRGGAGGRNQLQGGAGDDDYYVDGNDTVVELVNEGHDRVFTTRDRLTLAANVEDLTYVGVGAFIGVGNGEDNLMTGDAGDDVLAGRGGADVLEGGGGRDTADYSLAASGVIASLADGGAADDGDGSADTFDSIENLLGSAWDDELTGDAGANVLDGGDGFDLLIGGAGLDVLRGGLDYDMADYSGAAGGVVVKLNVGLATNDGDGSSDQLVSVEDVTGSDFDDLIIGDTIDNYLYGGSGRDVLIGGEGDDQLEGGNGAANQLQGGLGDDSYYVEANDTLVEFANEGYDTVVTTLNRYTLRANFEELFFDGVGNFIGTGNAEDNTIVGGSGDDILTGGLGDDILVGTGACGCGGSGNDTVVLAGVFADYVIQDLGAGGWLITDSVGGRDGEDLLIDIDQLRFSDGSTFALVPADPAPLVGGKDVGAAQILPGLADDNFVLAKDAGLPLVLPGAAMDGDAVEGLRDGFSPDAVMPRHWLTLAAGETLAGGTDNFGWLQGHDAWLS